MLNTYDEVARIVAMYNEHLQHDGYELVAVTKMSGRPVYAGRSRLVVPGSLRQVERAVSAGDREYLSRQITRMESSIESDPELAIGTAKELIETCCKGILATMQVEVDRGWDLPRLVKETATALRLTPDAVRTDADEAEAIRRILGNLGSIAGGIAELRNSYGTGHGRASGQTGLRSRHARLAVGAASTLVVFLFDTYDQRSANPT